MDFASQMMNLTVLAGSLAQTLVLVGRVFRNDEF